MTASPAPCPCLIASMAMLTFATLISVAKDRCVAIYSSHWLSDSLVPTTVRTSATVPVSSKTPREICEYSTTLSTQYPVVMRSKKRKCCLRSPSRVLYTEKRPYSACPPVKVSSRAVMSAQGWIVFAASKCRAACQAREPAVPTTARRVM
jgi:hypothetical protein